MSKSEKTLDPVDLNEEIKNDQLSDEQTPTFNNPEFEERQDPEDDYNLDDYNPNWMEVTKLKIKTNGLKLYGNFNAPIWRPTEMTSNADLLIKIMKNSKLAGVIPCHKKFICDNVPYLEAAFSRNWNLNEEVPGMSHFVIDVPSDFQPKNALTLFEYLYAQEIQPFNKQITESSDFEELREIVDIHWLADFLGCEQIANWVESVIDDHANYHHLIDLWKRNPNKFHDTLAEMMQHDSTEPDFQQDFLNGIRKNVSKIENSDELDRFLEIMNVDESCDENSELGDTKHSEAKCESQISEAVSKRLRNNANETIQVKTEVAPSCAAPYCKLQIQLAWFLESKNKETDFEYLKKCIFSTNFEHKDFEAEPKCEFFQSIVCYLDDSLIKEVTAHIFRKRERDSQITKNYSEKLSSILTVLKPSDEELAEMTKLSIECGDAKTKKSLEAIKRKRESKDYDMFVEGLYNSERIDRLDVDRKCYEYNPDNNSDAWESSKVCWTDFIDETVDKVSWKVHIEELDSSEFFSIGVQIITEKNMIKRNENQSHNAKFYCWKTKQRADGHRDYSYRQITNHKIEYPPDKIEQIKNKVEQNPEIDYKYSGFRTNDSITVRFDLRNRTIKFLKDGISQGIADIAFTAKDVVKGRARFFIQMGSPEDCVEIRNYDLSDDLSDQE